MEEVLMKIGELAAFFNISVKSLRIYEKKKILVPAKVDQDTGYRYYTADQIQTLNALLELKALGFTLTEIKDITSGKLNNSGFIETLARKKSAWQDIISNAENKIRAIEKIRGQITKTNEGAGLDELSDEQRAWLLAKMVCVEDMRGFHILSEALWL